MIFTRSYLDILNLRTHLILSKSVSPTLNCMVWANAHVFKGRRISSKTSLQLWNIWSPFGPNPICEVISFDGRAGPKVSDFFEEILDFRGSIPNGGTIYPRTTILKFIQRSSYPGRRMKLMKRVSPRDPGFPSWATSKVSDQLRSTWLGLFDLYRSSKGWQNSIADVSSCCKVPDAVVIFYTSVIQKIMAHRTQTFGWHDEFFFQFSSGNCLFKR